MFPASPSPSRTSAADSAIFNLSPIVTMGHLGNFSPGCAVHTGAQPFDFSPPRFGYTHTTNQTTTQTTHNAITYMTNSPGPHASPGPEPANVSAPAESPSEPSPPPAPTVSAAATAAAEREALGKTRHRDLHGVRSGATMPDIGNMDIGSGKDTIDNGKDNDDSKHGSAPGPIDWQRHCGMGCMAARPTGSDTDIDSIDIGNDKDAPPPAPGPLPLMTLTMDKLQEIDTMLRDDIITKDEHDVMRRTILFNYTDFPTKGNSLIDVARFGAASVAAEQRTARLAVNLENFGRKKPDTTTAAPKTTALLPPAAFEDEGADLVRTSGHPPVMHKTLQQYVNKFNGGTFDRYTGSFNKPNTTDKALPKKHTFKLTVPNPRNPMKKAAPSDTLAAHALGARRAARDSRLLAGRKSPPRIGIKQHNGDIRRVQIDQIPSTHKACPSPVRRLRRHNTELQISGCGNCKYSWRGCSRKGCVGPTWKPVDYSILAMGPSRKRSEEQKKKKSDKKKADLLARKEIRKRIERVNDQLIKNVRLLEEADL